MKKGQLGSEGLLLLAAILWGLAFVAQRVGMRHVGPFTFNTVRFALGRRASYTRPPARLDSSRGCMSSSCLFSASL